VDDSRQALSGNYLPIFISFNSTTIYQAEELSNPFLTRIALCLKHLQCQLDKRVFDSEMADVTKQFEHVAMKDLIKMIADAAAEKSRYVVFLVDEVCRVVGRPGFSAMLSEFKKATRLNGCSSVWTTFEHTLYETPDDQNRAQTGPPESNSASCDDSGAGVVTTRKPTSYADKTISGNPLSWIALSRFSNLTMQEIIKVEPFTAFANNPTHKFVISLLSGHQRSIEFYSELFKEPSGFSTMISSPDKIITEVETALRSGWDLVRRRQIQHEILSVKDYITILHHVAFSRPVNLESSFWQDLIAWSIVLNSFQSQDPEIPLFHPVLLKILVADFVPDSARTKSASPVDPTTIHGSAVPIFDHSRYVLTPSSPAEMPRPRVLPGEDVSSSQESSCGEVFHHTRSYDDGLIIENCVETSASRWNGLRKLFIAFYDSLPDVRLHWYCLERIHIYWECLRHSLMYRTHKQWTLASYYDSNPSPFYNSASRSLDQARDYQFVSVESPIPVPGPPLASEDDLHAFLAKRAGACLAPRNQAGFDSALWAEAYQSGADEVRSVLFLYENKHTTLETKEKILEVSTIESKLNLVTSEITTYNEYAKKNGTQPISMKDVIVVFGVLQSLRKQPSTFAGADFEGTALVLQRDYLVDQFFGTFKPFFEISDSLNVSEVAPTPDPST